MKYTKTAAALAMAGMAAAPLAQADDHSGPAVTLSGSVAINFGSDDSDATDGNWTLSGDDSVLNIAATDTLSNGLEGYANYRLDSALTGSAPAGDNIYVGVKGDFGDIRIGEVPDASEYGQVAGDILDDVGGENAGMSYTGAFGPATVGLNYSPAGNNDRFGVGAKFNAGGFGIGIGLGSVNDAQDVMSVGATYSLGGIGIAAAYKDLDTHQSIGLKLSGTAGDIGWGLTYEGRDGDIAAADNSKIRFDASYGLGGGWTVAGRANILDVGSDIALDDAGVAEADLTDYRLQFSKSF